MPRDRTCLKPTRHIVPAARSGLRPVPARPADTSPASAPLGDTEMGCNHTFVEPEACSKPAGAGRNRGLFHIHIHTDNTTNSLAPAVAAPTRIVPRINARLTKLKRLIVGHLMSGENAFLTASCAA